tara:strand:- start:703 stop:2499 length:1797 start_codon:yes stop_codon:yes gene_type:complete
MLFYRILNNQLHPVEEVNSLGFEEADGLRIPDEYLDTQEFVILRTAHGIGDWGIISAIPRLLKAKYPNCKVYIPSISMIKNLFGLTHNNSYNIFHNNPYVDKVLDTFDGEIFHDQYRVYNNSNVNIPLIDQILRFWQFDAEEYSDSQPELYWTDEEQKLGDSIINKYSNGEFGCLLLSDRFGTQRGKFDQTSYDRDTKKIKSVLGENSIPYFYWSYKPIEDTPFNFIDTALDMRHIDIRIQLYIKSKARLNISNQCGTNHLVVRYSDVFEAQRQYPIKHNFVKGITYISDYEPINLEYFLNMQVQDGGGGKEVCHQNGSLNKVRDIIDYWKVGNRIAEIQATLTPNNWQYFNCMVAGFKKGVEDHHEIGWDKLSASYYKTLTDMTDQEVEVFLKDNPVDFDNGFIKHGTHRAYAMMGRLIQGKPYTPFYMNREKIYNTPRKKDGKHRVKPLIESVFGIKEVLDAGIPASEFTITQSGILALMGIRKNEDIDIIISSKIRDKLFNGNKQFIRLDNGIEIFEEGKSKFMYFGAANEDDLINKFSFNVDGINFLEPRFYFRKKRKDRDKDKIDWEGICRFSDMGSEKGYPWNQLSIEQWGL